MKNITYTLPANEQVNLVEAVKSIYEKFAACYHKNPERYGNMSINALQAMWLETAKAQGIFQQLEKDGIAHILQTRDAYFTFSDHAGDMFDPEVNNDIDPEELKTQRRRELARFNRNGVWYHTLMVFGKELDSIGGFVGKDFYGSGYDTDFYATALENIRKQLPDYHSELIDAVSLI